MNKLAIFGGTGMTGRCAVAYALEKGIKNSQFSFSFYNLRNNSLSILPGKHVRILVRDEATIPDEFKGKVEVIKGDVLNADDVERTINGVDAVVIILGTRNSTEPTTMLSEGTKNIINAMKKFNLTVFSACMSSFLLMPPENVPKMFTDLNADHRRMLDVIKGSGLKFRAVLPPHIADEPSGTFQTDYDKSPGRTISKYDLGKFFIDCLENEDHSCKVIGIATVK